MNREIALSRCLVTGGVGFIGSHLVERLLEGGHEVTVLDNFSTGRMENLAHAKDYRRLTVHRADVSNYGEIEPFFKDVAWVFHLAALADIVPSIQQPLTYHKANESVMSEKRVLMVHDPLYAAIKSDKIICKRWCVL